MNGILLVSPSPCLLVFPIFLTGLSVTPTLKAGEEAMNMRRRRYLGTVLAVACALSTVDCVQATGVPISGFYPFAGISLTDQA